MPQARSRALPVLGALLGFAAPAAASDEERLDSLTDAQARAQYAAYTEDVRALRAARDDLAVQTRDGAWAPLALSSMAWADLRLAELAADGETALEHAADCVSDAAHALDADPGLAEAHALIAACRRIEAEWSPVRALLLSRSAESHLGEARQLGRGNPRVELLAAIDVLRTAGERSEAIAGLERALELFARERPAQPGAPDWGLAEAHAWLGSLHLAEGDFMRARNELEQALLIAPDYRWAAELRRRLEQQALNPDAT